MSLMHNIFVQFIVAVVIAVAMFVGTLASVDALMQAVQRASIQAKPSYEVDFSVIKHLQCRGVKCIQKF